MAEPCYHLHPEPVRLLVPPHDLVAMVCADCTQPLGRDDLIWVAEWLADRQHVETLAMRKLGDLFGPGWDQTAAGQRCLARIKPTWALARDVAELLDKTPARL